VKSLDVLCSFYAKWAPIFKEEGDSRIFMMHNGTDLSPVGVLLVFWTFFVSFD